MGQSVCTPMAKPFEIGAWFWAWESTLTIAMFESKVKGHGWVQGQMLKTTQQSMLENIVQGQGHEGQVQIYKV